MKDTGEWNVSSLGPERRFLCKPDYKSTLTHSFIQLLGMLAVCRMADSWSNLITSTPRSSKKPRQRVALDPQRATCSQLYWWPTAARWTTQNCQVDKFVLPNYYVYDVTIWHALDLSLISSLSHLPKVILPHTLPFQGPEFCYTDNEIVQVQ